MRRPLLNWASEYVALISVARRRRAIGVTIGPITILDVAAATAVSVTHGSAIAHSPGTGLRT